MLAPVLARLIEIREIDEARVDCSGTYFLLTGAEPGALERALPAIREVLGAGTQRVEGAAREEQLSRRDRGELWFSKDDIRGLSYVEGRVLAARMTDAVAADLSLEPATKGGVLDAVRAEILAALDHAHDTGGRSSSSWFWKEWPRIVDRIGVRLGGVCDDPQREAIKAALRAQGNSG